MKFTYATKSDFARTENPERANKYMFSPMENVKVSLDSLNSLVGKTSLWICTKCDEGNYDKDDLEVSMAMCLDDEMNTVFDRYLEQHGIEESLCGNCA